MNQLHKNPFRIYEICFTFCTSIFLCLLLLSAQAVAGGGHSWDGIVVTQGNYQALQAIKHELIDFTGVLRSWNDSSTTSVCSGGWAGIKCLRGQVVAIQLPWKGLGGTISEKIGQLQNLRKLSLHDTSSPVRFPVPLAISRTCMESISSTTVSLVQSQLHLETALFSKILILAIISYLESSRLVLLSPPGSIGSISASIYSPVPFRLQ